MVPKTNSANQELWYGCLVQLCQEDGPRNFTSLNWDGPCKLLTRLSDNAYRIKRTQRPFKTKVIHFDRLKRCLPGTRFPQPSTDHHHMHAPEDSEQEISPIKPPPGANLEVSDIDNDPAPPLFLDTLNVTIDRPRRYLMILFTTRLHRIQDVFSQGGERCSRLCS